MRRLALLAAALPVLLGGCAAINVGPVFAVSVANDTTGAVVIHDCPDYCSSSGLDITLPPGASTPLNRPTQQHDYFSVISASGAHLGCVDLYFARPSPGAVVPVTSAASCPAGSGVPWVPVILVTLALLGLVAFFFRSD